MSLIQMIENRNALLTAGNMMEDLPDDKRDELFALEREISLTKPTTDQEAVALLQLAKEMIDISGEDDEKSIIKNMIKFMERKTAVRQLDNQALLAIYKTAEKASEYFPENAMHVTIDYQSSGDDTVECVQIGNNFSRIVIVDDGICSVLDYDGESNEPELVFPTSVNAFLSTVDNPVQMAGVLSALTRIPIGRH